MKRILFMLAAVAGTSSAFCSTTYSSAVTAGDYLYVSGQFPIDPTTGKIIEGDIETLTNQVINNIEHVMHTKGFTLSQVVKTEVFLTDIRDYDSMDSAYGHKFNFAYPPARDVIQAANLLYNSPIEISCIAYRFR